MDNLVALRAKRYAVVQVESQFWILGKRDDVVGVQVATVFKVRIAVSGVGCHSLDSLPDTYLVSLVSC